MPGPRRKGVARDGFEGMAHQCGSGARLGPFEGPIWLWLYHFSMANILGLGLDATDIDRITATISRYGDRFVTRIFTTNEIAYCARRHTPAIHFAGRFAAKDAAMKALGTGHSRGVLWRDIEVVRHGGPPQLQFHGGAGRRFHEMGGRSSLLTITHSDDLALAQVLILGD
jgi:holo-[acyl-carrier protein] synthase